MRNEHQVLCCESPLSKITAISRMIGVALHTPLLGMWRRGRYIRFFGTCSCYRLWQDLAVGDFGSIREGDADSPPTTSLLGATASRIYPQRGLASFFRYALALLPSTRM